MKPESFVHYIRGFAETNSNPPTVEQWRVIANRLESVFEKRTPEYTRISGFNAPTGNFWDSQAWQAETHIKLPPGTYC